MSRSIARRRRGRWPSLAVLVLSAGALGACSSVFSEMPQQVGGLPQGAPERPAVQPDYPAVNDIPKGRAERPMTDAERKKVQADLDTARAAAAQRAAAGPPLMAR